MLALPIRATDAGADLALVVLVTPIIGSCGF